MEPDEVKIGMKVRITGTNSKEAVSMHGAIGHVKDDNSPFVIQFRKTVPEKCRMIESVAERAGANVKKSSLFWAFEFEPVTE